MKHTLQKIPQLSNLFIFTKEEKEGQWVSDSSQVPGWVSSQGRVTPAAGSEQHTPVYALSPNCQLHSPQHTDPPSLSLNALRSAHCGSSQKCPQPYNADLWLWWWSYSCPYSHLYPSPYFSIFRVLEGGRMVARVLPSEGKNETFWSFVSVDRK